MQGAAGGVKRTARGMGVARTEQAAEEAAGGPAFQIESSPGRIGLAAAELAVRDPDPSRCPQVTYPALAPGGDGILDLGRMDG